MSNPMLMGDDDVTGGLGQTPGKNKEPRWDEKISWLNFPDDGQPYSYRLVGRPTFFFNHWVTIRKRDGAWGKPLAILCKNFNSATGKTESRGCKVCEYMANVSKVYGDMKIEYAKWPDQLKKMSARSTMAINAIIREIQQQGAPSNSKDWTFVHPIKFPKGVAEAISEKAKKFNRKPGAKQDDPQGFYGFNHAQYGKDIFISYNSQEDASKMYDIQVGERTALSTEELEHAKYMVDFASHIKYMPDEGVEEVLRRSGYYETLQSLQAQYALNTASAKVGLPTNTTAAPAVEIPKTTSVPQAATTVAPVPSAMQTDDGGGMEGGTEEEVPSVLTQATKSTEATQPVAPIAKPATVVGSSGDFTSFAQQHKRSTKTVTEDYSQHSLKLVKTGTVVPDCFSSYSETRKTSVEMCKTCPIKLDCMQVEP